ncbi:MAG: hypothetical protein U0165_10025 [Polyangiaceae bacterium]
MGALAQHTRSEELSVWAGHDLWSPRGRFDSSSKRLSLRRVGDGYNHNAEVVTIELNPADLRQAFEQTQGELIALSRRIADVFPTVVDRRKARRISAHIVGLDEHLVAER